METVRLLIEQQQPSNRGRGGMAGAVSFLHMAGAGVAGAGVATP